MFRDVFLCSVLVLHLCFFFIISDAFLCSDERFREYCSLGILANLFCLPISCYSLKQIVLRSCRSLAIEPTLDVSIKNEQILQHNPRRVNTTN